MQYDPETVKAYLTPDQYSLYRLIWNRFVASQMNPATFDETMVDITAGAYVFRAKGTVPKFAGWMATYGLTPGETEKDQPEGASKTEGDEDDVASGVLPPLEAGQRLELRTLRPEQKFTQPPPRFSEATLVKELEENGIGRPSTYASIIGVLQDRDYVNKIEGRFKPSGTRRDDQRPADQELRRHHRRRVHAHLEDDLDKIEQGKTDYARTLTDFYKKFKKDLAAPARK
jgi:DNA topoisomerase-1